MAEDFEILSWVLRGSQRRAIIQVMDGRKIPAQIYAESRKINGKISRNSVSDVLRAFVKNKLAKCLNPNAVKGRIYVLTDVGKSLREDLVTYQK